MWILDVAILFQYIIQNVFFNSNKFPWTRLSVLIYLGPTWNGGNAVAQWLRCCAKNQKVAGSFPNGLIGIFHSRNPSDRTMALGSTQPLIEMSTRRISWNRLGHSRPVTGLIYILPTIYRVIHKSLLDFRNRLRNNKDRHGRKEHINR